MVHGPTWDKLRVDANSEDATEHQHTYCISENKEDLTLTPFESSEYFCVLVRL
jgi:hypothetical protein